MTRYHCSMCNRCYHPSYQTFCMHPENYSELMDTYDYEVDAGYKCPLNKAQEDYISLIDEKIAQTYKEDDELSKMKANGIIKPSELVDEDSNELDLLQVTYAC